MNVCKYFQKFFNHEFKIVTFNICLSVSALEDLNQLHLVYSISDFLVLWVGESSIVVIYVLFFNQALNQALTFGLRSLGVGEAATLRGGDEFVAK